MVGQVCVVETEKPQTLQSSRSKGQARNVKPSDYSGRKFPVPATTTFCETQISRWDRQRGEFIIKRL